MDAAYNAQVPSDVATALRANAERLADVSVGLDDDGWSRVGIRRDDERMSVEAHLRFALHESVHHRHDATTT